MLTTNGPLEENDKSVDELVEMLDKLMSEGGGHVNVSAGEEFAEGVRVDTFKSSDCGLGACCQPNEEAPDEDDDL